MKKTPSKVLKFPILKNVEYVTIYRTGRSVLELDGKDLENLTWRQFQLYLGERIPVGKCQFTMKFNNDSQLHTGQIRAAKVGEAYSPNPKDETSNMTTEILNEFKSLKDALSKATNQGGVSFEMLLASSKSAYEAQLGYKDQIILAKDELIRELKEDLNECESENSEMSKSSDWVGMLNQYKPMIELALAKIGAKTPAKLSANQDHTGIPGEVLDILAVVDYDKLKTMPEQYQQILSYLRQYISVLPMKGQ